MVSLSYAHLQKNQTKVITYATQHSDFFSLITYQKKPYSQRPPLCVHDGVLHHIRNSLVSQLVGIREWSGSGENNNHVVMNVYRCDHETRAFLLRVTELFTYSAVFPEDLCFYRGRQAWLSVTTHEAYAPLQYIRRPVPFR